MSTRTTTDMLRMGPATSGRGLTRRGAIALVAAAGLALATGPRFSFADAKAPAASAATDVGGYLYAACTQDKDGSNRLWGFVDKTGAWVIKPAFADVMAQPGTYVPYALMSTGGQDDVDSKRIAAVTGAVAGVFTDDLYGVQDVDTKLWGYIDRTGAWKIKPAFRGVTAFLEGMAVVASDADKSLHYIKPDGSDAFGAMNADFATCFLNGIASMSAPGSGWAALDTTGAWTLGSKVDPTAPYVYNDPLVFSEGLAKNDTTYLDTAGNVVIDFSGNRAFEGDHDPGHDFHGGRIFDSGYLYDATGALTSVDDEGAPMTGNPGEGFFDDAAWTTEGIVALHNPYLDLYGYGDGSGTLSIPAQFSAACPFSEGKAFVKDVATQCGGFVDATGAWVIGPRFTYDETRQEPMGSMFKGGLAYVGADVDNYFKYGWIDESGAWVVTWGQDLAESKTGRSLSSVTDAAATVDPQSLVGDYKEGSVDIHVGQGVTDLNIASVAADGTVTATGAWEEGGGTVELNLAGKLVQYVDELGRSRITCTLFGHGEKHLKIVVGVATQAPGDLGNSADGLQALAYEAHMQAVGTENGVPLRKLLSFEDHGNLEVPPVISPTKQ